MLPYPDGARISNGKAGGRYVILQVKQKVTSGRFSINRQVKPIDIGIIAIYKVLSACTLNAHLKFATNIIILSYCQAEIAIIDGKKTNTCRKEFEETNVIDKYLPTRGLGKFWPNGSQAIRILKQMKK